MKIEVNKRMKVDIDDDEVDDIVAQHIYNTYWNCLDDLNPDEQIYFNYMYKFFSGKELHILTER